MIHKRKITIQKVFIIVIINLIVATTVFLIIEGLSSSIFVAEEAISGSLIPARRHTQYDEELGWINLPNLYIKNMYGPGIYFKTNSQLFRNDKDFSRTVPSGKVRIICSGDSYTLGYGVDNDHTWCQLLVIINKRLETVNLGQGGYGVDQAYLWYKRNSTLLEHNIHIFAFITNDFERMKNDTFLGYDKPFLKLQDGVLIIKNRPVPKRSFSMPRLTRALRAMEKLNSLRLLRRFFFENGPSLSESHDDQQDTQNREIAATIFENLQQINQAQNSTLILVYLPTIRDYLGIEVSEGYRQWLHEEAGSNGWLFIDLIDEFRKYPPQEVKTLFFLGHYSEKGNTYIADILYKKLRAVSEISDKLRER